MSLYLTTISTFKTGNYVSMPRQSEMMIISWNSIQNYLSILIFLHSYIMNCFEVIFYKKNDDFRKIIYLEQFLLGIIVSYLKVS